jgi:four helix bundle protein
MFAYEKLEVWQAAKNVAVKVYSATRNFPTEEKYGLISQINRAIVSVASNIAEGNSRTSLNEKAHFTEISYGSLMEVCCHFQIALELGFIGQETWTFLYKDLEQLARLLSAYRNSQLNRMTR